MATTHGLLERLQTLGGGEFAHLNGSLSTHLKGTEALLRSWGASETLCVAGLFHAIYGTDGYGPAWVPVARRSGIAELIGAEAEAFVYLFGACNRKVFYPRIGTEAQLLFADRFESSEYVIETRQLAGLCELILANELEIANGSVAFRARHLAALSRLFERMSALVSHAGFEAYRTLLRAGC